MGSTALSLSSSIGHLADREQVRGQGWTVQKQTLIRLACSYCIA
jgi:hypothetical protein